MLDINYDYVNESKVMVEHHYLSDKLTKEQKDDFNEQTRMIINPVTKTEYGYCRMNHVTFMLGFSSMVIGLSKIVKYNIDEWFYRMNVLERINGTRLGEVAYSYDDIVAHKNLSVNTHAESREWFDKKMIKDFGKDAFELAVNAEPVEGSNYDHSKTGLVKELKVYQDSYGDALVSEAPKEEE